MQTAHTQDLRADVRATLQAQVIASLPRADWSDYERAKRALSSACGWDAPPERYDQQQYESGLAAYLRAVDL